MTQNAIKTVGIIGIGAIGSSLVQMFMERSIKNHELIAICDNKVKSNFPFQNLTIEQLAECCDLIVDCTPAHAAPSIAEQAFIHGREHLLASTGAKIIHEKALTIPKENSCIQHFPAGALHGIADNLREWSKLGISDAEIETTKHPDSFRNIDYTDKHGETLKEKLDRIEKTDKSEVIFEGTVREAITHFPNSINVGVTLSLISTGADETRVILRADPQAKGSSHKATVKCGADNKTRSATATSPVSKENTKTSLSTAISIWEVINDRSKALKSISACPSP